VFLPLPLTGSSIAWLFALAGLISLQGSVPCVPPPFFFVILPPFARLPSRATPKSHRPPAVRHPSPFFAPAPFSLNHAPSLALAYPAIAWSSEAAGPLPPRCFSSFFDETTPPFSPVRFLLFLSLRGQERLFWSLFPPFRCCSGLNLCKPFFFNFLLVENFEEIFFFKLFPSPFSVWVISVTPLEFWSLKVNLFREFSPFLGFFRLPSPPPPRE